MIMDKKGEKLFTIETRDIKQTTHVNVRKIKPSEFAENILLMESEKLCCYVSERLNKIIVISTGPTLALRQSKKMHEAKLNWCWLPSNFCSTFGWHMFLD